MRTFALDEANNNKHNYKLINMSQGIDLIPFLSQKNLTYSKFQKTVDEKLAANSMSFTLKFPYSTKQISATSEKYMYIDSDLLKGLFIDTLTTDISIVNVTGLVNVVDLVKENHEFIFQEIFNGDEFNIFNGIVEKVEFNREKTFFSINVTVKDKTNFLYEMKYKESHLFRDMHLSNNALKSNSLLHQLCYLLDFKDEELDIDDIKDSNNFIVIPFVHLKKDELIIKDLAEAVRLVNLVFTIENNKLTIKTSRIPETYIFTKNNTYAPLKFNTVKAEFEKIKVTYDRYFKKDKQMMWALAGENGTSEAANVLIRAGQTRKFTVKWFYEVGIIDELEAYEIIFKDINGTIISGNYTLDVTETGGKLAIIAGVTDIYVTSFKIKGIPLWMQDGNTSYYPATIQTEKIKEITNKFIQNETLAALAEKIYYQSTCRDYKEFDFSTNIANFLMPGVKIFLDHEDFKNYLIIDSISFAIDKMSIKAREYLTEYSINDFEFLDKTTVDEEEAKSKNLLEELGLYEKDKPMAPINLILESEPLGFLISFNIPAGSMKGYYLYIKKASEVDFRKIFINTNYYFYQTTYSDVYLIKISSLSINGFEGDCTEIKQVKAMLVSTNNVDYPAGCSPAELDAKVLGINTAITGIVAINTEHSEKIELVEADIISMKEVDYDNFTAIEQNAVAITNVAQTVATKTSASDVTNITNSAIESFSANEFKRTVGTRISKIDYSHAIDSPELTFAIDSDELKEVVIEDYYTSIRQNSTEILSLVKKSDEQYSSIQQLVDKINLLVSADSDTFTLIQQLTNEITLLVKKDDDNYSLIQQLADGINLLVTEDVNTYSSIQQLSNSITNLVKKDNDNYTLIEQLNNEMTFAVREDEVVTAINLSSEGVVIAGDRISLGSGLVVENGKVVVRELGAENIRAGAITADKIKVGDNFEVGVAGELKVKKVTSESIATGTINGIAGAPIILGANTEIKGNVKLDDGNSINLTNSVKIGKNSRGTNLDGILIENGGLEVRNASGVTIFDGTSNILKIHQTGVITIPANTFIGSIYFPALPYNPTFLIYYSDASAKCTLTSHWAESGSVKGVVAACGNNVLNLFNYDVSHSITIRYYIFKEAGI